MSRKNLFLIVSICVVGVIFAFVMNRHSKKVQASGSGIMFQEINSSALAAQSGQPTDIGNLVDTIFAENGIDQLDSNLVASLKDRIVRAESNGQTVSESQVVQALNWLADDFSAPAYAKTSSLQTRVLKLTCNGIMPNLFVDKDSQGNIGVNKPLYSQPSNNISATQAITLLILMIHQKTLNEHFQKEPVQWDSDFYATQQSGNSYQQDSGSSSPKFFGRIASQKTNEMQQIVYATYFSQTDQERLAQGTLDQLGIPR